MDETVRREFSLAEPNAVYQRPSAFVTTPNRANLGVFWLFGGCCSGRLGKITRAIGKPEVFFAKVRVDEFDCHPAV